MDFLLNINGMNNTQQWKQMNHQQHKVETKKFESEENNTNENASTQAKSLKKYLIDLQDNISLTQDKINILEVAGESLNEIAGSLEDLKNRTLSKIDQLEGFSLDEEVKDKFKNITKLEALQEGFLSIPDKKDTRYEEILKEFKEVSNITLEFAQNETFKDEVNSNVQLEEFLGEINHTITSVSTAKESLEKVKDKLITNIVNLNVTLENMNSSYNRIRNVDLASQAIKIAQKHILDAAKNGIKVELQVTDTSINKLIS